VEEEEEEEEEVEQVFVWDLKTWWIGKEMQQSRAETKRLA
jgi:hypothetical protein